MIKISEEMKKQKSDTIALLCKRVDVAITDAVKDGRTRTYFPVDKDNQYYTEIRKMYEAEGYRIIPTGYNGGVWQLTEDIVW